MVPLGFRPVVLRLAVPRRAPSDMGWRDTRPSPWMTCGSTMAGNLDYNDVIQPNQSPCRNPSCCRRFP